MVNKKTAIVKVFIDTREQKVRNQALTFFKNQNIMAQEHANEDGDLIFILKGGSKLYIERKSFSDFASSYIKKHIQDQAIRLSKYDYYACIVHGNINQLKNISILSKIKQPSIDKMAHNLMIFYKLPLFFVDNIGQYFNLSMQLAESVAKHNGVNISSIKLQEGFKARPDISMITAQNDIGFKTADMLLNEFGSPKNVLNASRKDLLNIKGIGDGTISKIKALKHIYEEGLND